MVAIVIQDVVLRYVYNQPLLADFDIIDRDLAWAVMLAARSSGVASRSDGSGAVRLAAATMAADRQLHRSCGLRFVFLRVGHRRVAPTERQHCDDEVLLAGQPTWPLHLAPVVGFGWPRSSSSAPPLCASGQRRQVTAGRAITSLVVILLVLISVPALLRFFGFAEPSAAILGALAAICFVMPLDVTQLTSVLDFGRIDLNIWSLCPDRNRFAVGRMPRCSTHKPAARLVRSGRCRVHRRVVGRHSFGSQCLRGGHLQYPNRRSRDRCGLRAGDGWGRCADWPWIERGGTSRVNAETDWHRNFGRCLDQLSKHSGGTFRHHDAVRSIHVF